jgi:hypothetical protein
MERGDPENSFWQVSPLPLSMQRGSRRRPDGGGGGGAHDRILVLDGAERATAVATRR